MSLGFAENKTIRDKSTIASENHTHNSGEQLAPQFATKDWKVAGKNFGFQPIKL